MAGDCAEIAVWFIAVAHEKLKKILTWIDAEHPIFLQCHFALLYKNPGDVGR